MRTVRAKLVLLVLACLVPTLAGVILQAYETRDELLDQAEQKVDDSNQQFDAQLEQDERAGQLALELVAQATGFSQALATRDHAKVSAAVKLLVSAYQYRIALAADRTGAVVAEADGAKVRHPLATAEGTPLPALVSARPVTGLIALPGADGSAYALVTAIPVLQNGSAAGSLALLTPVSTHLMDYFERRSGTHMALWLNGQRIAACPDDPDPALRDDDFGVVLRRSAGQLFATKTFHPVALESAGEDVEVTASRDVTALVADARADLAQAVGLVGAVLALVVALALAYAGRIGRSVRELSRASDAVRQGSYMTVALPKSKDELGRLSADFNAMVQGLKERDRIKDTFGRYVTRQVAEHLMKGEVELGGELVPATVLFSDIRAFTTISERMEPKALLDFLNVYFSGMVESVLQNDGVVDKFMGDAIMAVFGPPVPSPLDPLHAVRAALGMRERLRRINEGFRAQGLPEIKSGIGLHSGMVVAGNMGHEMRMEYTVIGDTVNVASRLESATKELHTDVVVSEDLYRQVEAQVEVEPLGAVKVKGREQQVRVYRLVRLREDASATAA